jgi:hypothetical protein
MLTIARVRSSAVGASILAALAYLLLLGVMWSTGHPVGPGTIAAAGLVALVVGADIARKRSSQRRAERDAGGPAVLAAADRACRHGERPADPALAAAARAWVRRRAEFRRRSSRWAAAAWVAGAVAAVAVGAAAHRPLGYGVAVLCGVLAVAQPINERDFRRYYARADAVLRGDPDPDAR